MRPIAPLDDAYITLQYARQIARGYPYQYNDGDAPTTGMTSPFFGFLMAGFYWLGFTGERLVGLAVGLGILWLCLIVWLTYRLSGRLLGSRDARGWAWGAALLVTFSGCLQWACFNGMETGFFIVLTLAAMEAYFAHRIRPCGLWLALAALTRPEGLVLAGLVWTTHLVERQASADRAFFWQRTALLTTAVGIGLIPSLVNWALTGTPSAAGLRAKSWLLNVPPYRWEILRSILTSYRHIVGLFLGWQSKVAWFVPPGVLLLAGLGLTALWLRRQRSQPVLIAAWFGFGTLSTATLITATWHNGRYQVPFVPWIIMLAVCGLAFLWRRIQSGWRYVTLAAMLFLFMGMLYSTVHFALSYRENLSTVARQQLIIADWLRANVPAGARVGVHDTGSLRYVGGRPTYDLVGLTTAGATIPWRHGAGSVFEQMEHSPTRPDYFAIYPDVFSIPYLAATDLFAEELFRVEVSDYALASAGPVQGVWRADWHLAGSGETFYQPDVAALLGSLDVVDVLDVADLHDEEQHSLTWWNEAHRTGFPTEVQQLTYRARPQREVLDGGRLVTGGMAFDATTTPGEDLWLVARLHARQAGAVRVVVDGRQVGQWAYPRIRGQWQETVFHVPAAFITQQQAHIVLYVDTPNPAFRHYAPYHFWFLQGEPQVESVDVAQPINVSFETGDGNLTLLGFNLTQNTWQAGETLSTTLYWQTPQKTTNKAKVFLHLYDASGELGPQTDGYPFYGTRPPYTWLAGETVTDPRIIALPPDLAAGSYTLEVGLYDFTSGERYAAYVDGERQAKERVVLATIEIKE